MSDYSDTDLRVIRAIRAGTRSTTAIGKACFYVSGKKHNATRPAAAHLVRMSERGLVKRMGSYWYLTDKVKDPGPDLFETQDLKTQDARPE